MRQCAAGGPAATTPPRSHDHRPRDVLSRLVSRAVTDPARLDHAAVTALQRATGNRALAAVLQRDTAGAGRVLMRSPVPAEAEPRTIIVTYGSGQLNPTTNSHNVGSMFQAVAAQKLKEIRSRLGAAAEKHTFVVEYTPTENELKAVLNKKYSAPIAEVHIFSHGWDEGANLGGPAPAAGTRRPATESPDDAEQRRLRKDDLGGYQIDFAEDAIVVLYGCNIGNVDSADAGRPFAQDIADQFGVTVTASTRSTHFENKGGWHQVPDAGGRMLDFTPDPTVARTEIEGYLRLVAELGQARARLAAPKRGGLLSVMYQEARLQARVDELGGQVAAKKALVHRMLRFLPTEQRNAAQLQLDQAEAAVTAP